MSKDLQQKAKEKKFLCMHSMQRTSQGLRYKGKTQEERQTCHISHYFATNSFFRTKSY